MTKRETKISIEKEWDLWYVYLITNGKKIDISPFGFHTKKEGLKFAKSYMFTNKMIKCIK